MDEVAEVSEVNEYDRVMDQVREYLRTLLVARYDSALSQKEIFLQVTDLFLADAGSFALLQLVVALE